MKEQLEEGEQNAIAGADAINEEELEQLKGSVGEISDTQEDFITGQMGDIQRLTSEQFGNIKQLATNPFSFISGIFVKKMVKGGIIVGIALLIFEMVKFIIDELMKPGRWLDRRFRRVAQDEILLFTDAQTQQELRQGFKEVRVTTMEGLRGASGQVGGNFFNPERIPHNRLDQRRVTSNKRAQGDIQRGRRRRFGQ